MFLSLSFRSQLQQYTCRSCLLQLTRSSKRQFSTSPRPLKSHRAKTALLPSQPARTRFAPSPTGYLHLGSLRTALFNYLLAKATGGQFLLRIEDTDQKRTVADAEKRLFQDLRWAGIQWDEGPEVGGPYGPYKQSERSTLYQEHAQKLLDSGSGYRCFCSAERLKELAESRHRQGLATDYDRTCAHIPKEESDDRASRGEKYVVRLRAPDSYPVYEDIIYGKFKALKQGRRAAESYEDPILLKSDGLPTYHLANVVDDHHMKITHVIRGTEWMPSTPKHIAMYNAFGWTPPEFAHVPLLVDEQGNKLSKRNFDTDISAFKEMEIFPEALTNFATLLGWSHMEKSEVMTMQRLIENFKMKFTKGNATVTFHKLHFLQRKHASRRIQEGGEGLNDLVETIAERLRGPENTHNWKAVLGSRPLEKYVEQIVKADSEHYTNSNEFIYRNAFFFNPLTNPSSTTDVDGIPTELKRLAEVDGWSRQGIERVVWDIVEARGGKEDKTVSREVFHYLRKSLTGAEEGTRLWDIMIALGRDECLRRLNAVPRS